MSFFLLISNIILLMKARIFIGPYDHRCVWLGLSFAIISAFSLLIGSVLTPIWATTSKNQFGLYTCSTSCIKDNYKDLRTLVCNQVSFIENISEESDAYLYQSGCLMFEGLESAFYIYSIFATGTSVFTIIWIVSIITFSSRKITYYCGLLFSLLTFISQASGISLWIIFTNTSLVECPDFPDDGSTPILCESTGVRLGMASGILYGIICIAYIVVGKIARKKLLVVKDDVNYFQPNTLSPENKNVTVKKVWNEDS
ncbi:hypothetical protein SteCoe_33872 [Stentor coeruleus]|uniref:Uncharacterized protein n=1 Tax=Stentor coeruleus TaxID=5963 RepID=A0A1R2AVY9_9CILI|nr:hypothetical protein SteCoe_33872 [Stentor coeruleus]